MSGQEVMLVDVGPAAQFTISPKRLSKRDQGIDGWYPYYAGFSSGFAQEALQSLAVTPADTVLDPWNGSGTTTLVARRLGATAIGIDLNPFACLVASAKLASEDMNKVSEIAEGALKEVTPIRGRQSRTDDPLAEWLPPRVGAHVRELVSHLAPSGVEDSLRTPTTAFVLLCLIRAARSLAVEETSNPTWPRSPSRTRGTQEQLRKLFRETVAGLLADPTKGRGRRSLGRTTIKVGDARSNGLPAGSVSVVLSSPPYCTRIDYAMQTRFELAVLGLACGPQFRSLRAALMGTTTIRERGVTPKMLPERVTRLLEIISTHPSYASRRYYAVNLGQYFADAVASLGEIQRVLRPGGRGYLVIQNSYYKDIEIDLPGLFAEMSHSVGLEAEVSWEQPVWPVMTSLNPRAKAHLARRAYRECVIRIERPKDE